MSFTAAAACSELPNTLTGPSGRPLDSRRWSHCSSEEEAACFSVSLRAHAGKSTHAARTTVRGCGSTVTGQGSEVAGRDGSRRRHAGAAFSCSQVQRADTTARRTPCSWGILLRAGSGSGGTRAAGDKRRPGPRARATQAPGSTPAPPGSRRWRPGAARCSNRRSSVELRPG